MLLKWPELDGTVLVLNDSVEDKIFWVSRDGKKSNYKESIVWEDFRAVNPPVNWYHLTWFSNSIPKHSFILWLAIRRKLMTQDRMQFWHHTENLCCVFCHLQLESVDHLFFECPFSSGICNFFLSKGLNFPFRERWSYIIEFAASKWKSE